MTLQRWSLPKEGYLPLFMLMSCLISAAILFFLRVQFPAANTTPFAQQAAAEITLLQGSQTARGTQTAAELRFLSKYTLTPPLPAAEIPAEKLIRIDKTSPLAAIEPPPLFTKSPPAATGQVPLTVHLISLLQPLLTLESPAIASQTDGQIVFVGEIKPVTPPPALPAIPTETPLRASVYQLALNPAGGVESVLLLETCGRADADRTGITLLRKIRFALPHDQSPVPLSLKVRIFWPQTAYSPPTP